MTTFLWAALIASAIPQAPTWLPVNKETSAITDAERLARLAVAHPNSATIARRQLVAAFQAGNREGGLAALERIEALGFVFLPDSYDQMAALVGTERAERARQAAELRRQPLGKSRVVATIPPSIRLTEGVVVDKAGRMFSGSVVERAIYMRSGAGQWQRLAVDGLGSITGLAIDEERGILWAASGKLDQTPGEQAFAGLVAVDLARLAESARHPAPDGVVGLNDIALAPDGSVLASDSSGGGVYRLGNDGRITTLIAPRNLRSPQGIAVHPSGSHAYVADYGYGIAIVDLASGALSRLAAPANVMLDGTDGLFWHDGNLVALQNGIRPMRIVYLDLDEAGGAVKQAITLERNNPDWGEVTIGQVSGDRLLYVANPQWDRFGDGGAVRGEAPLEPNQIREIVLPGGL